MGLGCLDDSTRAAKRTLCVRHRGATYRSEYTTAALAELHCPPETTAIIADANCAFMGTYYGVKSLDDFKREMLRVARRRGRSQSRRAPRSRAPRAPRSEPDRSRTPTPRRRARRARPLCFGGGGERKAVRGQQWQGTTGDGQGEQQAELTPRTLRASCKRIVCSSGSRETWRADSVRCAYPNCRVMK